jgi:hypothetical protein
MADLEEAELLRAVILGLLALLGLALRSAADAPIPDFAPGAQGPVEAPLPQLMNEAERRAEALRQRLELQEAAPESAFGVDIGAIAHRHRKVLGAPFPLAKARPLGRRQILLLHIRQGNVVRGGMAGFVVAFGGLRCG